MTSEILLYLFRNQSTHGMCDQDNGYLAEATGFSDMKVPVSAE